MLYDTIDLFKEYLGQRLSPETARTYTTHIKPLLKTQSINFTADRLDVGKVIAFLAQVKNKNNYAKYKNAFLYFCHFLNITLTDGQLRQIKEIGKQKPKKYRQLQATRFDVIDKKIKRLRNKKLKLSYQALLATGLRVAELAQITKDDCLIIGDELHFYFIGKGGIPSTTTISKKENHQLFDNLITLIEASKHKIFYSASYLQTNAKKLGFGCHDLRRIYAKAEYKKTKSKDLVRRKLRHSHIKTTNIYLKSKVIIKGG